MCGRFAMQMSGDEFERFLDPDALGATLFVGDLPEASLDIKPTDQVAILIADQKQPGVLRLEPARWALTPKWSKTLTTKSPLFNARIESALEKPSFKASALGRRCVVPATSFYEWSGPKGARVKHEIFSEEPLLLAGLASWWQGSDTGDGADVDDDVTDAWHLTTTILTMNSFGPIEKIHDRMPVLLGKSNLLEWLAPDVKGSEDLFSEVSDRSRELARSLQIT